MSAPAPVSDFDVNPAALLSGTVNEGNIGPSVGLLDIGVSDSAYLFRLALPGILKEPNSPDLELEKDTKWSREEGNVSSSLVLPRCSLSSFILSVLMQSDMADSDSRVPLVADGLKCEVHHSGRVQIQADMAELPATKDCPPGAFRLITPQLSSPGPFTVSFNLPGPVDARLFTPITRQDGVLEVVIMKSKRPGSSGGPSPEAPAQAI